MRYSSAMATIQVRDLPEETYEVIRRRARADGQSIQAYMRERVIEMAGQSTKAEALVAIERALERYGAPQVSVDDILADLGADRR